MQPTRIGLAMTFINLKGFPDSRLLVGLMASRERVSALLGAPDRKLGIQMAEARRNIMPLVIVDPAQAICQEVVFRTEDEGFDLRKILPAQTNTSEGVGLYFCLGLVLGSDPDDRDNINVTIHRLCVQGKDELSIFFAPGRHIDAFRQKAEAWGDPLPVPINMGLDPAIYIGAGFEAPTTPFGFNELSVAEGSVSRSNWRSASASGSAIAREEIVI